MPSISGTSSSEDELEHVKPKEDGNSGVSVKPIEINSSTPAAASSSKGNNGKLEKMLQLVLEAVKMVQSENPAKGISIQKIKKYLIVEHGMRKMVIQEQLRPTLETAIKLKMLLKTTGRVSVLIGSVKLNPAYREVQNPSSMESSSSSDEESAAEDAQPKAATNKRKVAREPEPAGNNKRRK